MKFKAVSNQILVTNQIMKLCVLMLLRDSIFALNAIEIL